MANTATKADGLLSSPLQSPQHHSTAVERPRKRPEVVWWAAVDQSPGLGSAPIASPPTPAGPAGPRAIETGVDDGIEGRDINGNAAPAQILNRVITHSRRISRNFRQSLSTWYMNNSETLPPTPITQTVIREDYKDYTGTTSGHSSRDPGIVHRRVQSAPLPVKRATMTQGILAVDGESTQPRQRFRQRLFWGRKRAATAQLDAQTEKKVSRQIYLPTHAARDFEATATSPRFQASEQAQQRKPSSCYSSHPQAELIIPEVQVALRESSSSRYSTHNPEKQPNDVNVDEGIETADTEAILDLYSDDEDATRSTTRSQPMTDYEKFITEAEAHERARRVSARWSAYQQQVILASRQQQQHIPPLPSPTGNHKSQSKRDSGYHTHSRHGSYEPGWGPNGRESWTRGLRSAASSGELLGSANGRSLGTTGAEQRSDLAGSRRKSVLVATERSSPPRIIQSLAEYIRPSRE